MPAPTAQVVAGRYKIEHCSLSGLKRAGKRFVLDRESLLSFSAVSFSFTAALLSSLHRRIIDFIYITAFLPKPQEHPNLHAPCAPAAPVFWSLYNRVSVMKGRFQIVFSDKSFFRNQGENAPGPSFALRLKHRLLAFFVAALATAFLLVAVFVGSLIAVFLSAILLIVILLVIFKATFAQTVRNLRAK